MDFNTTPPMRHDQGLQQPLSKDRDSRFLCVRCRRDHRRQEAVTTLTLVDGDAINSDKALYDVAVSPRTKEIDLGAYGDGMNRQRRCTSSEPASWDWLAGRMALSTAAATLRETGSSE